MLQYGRNDISEEIDTYKTSTSKECMLCHYRYFKNIGYKFESNAHNKFHYILMTAYEFKNIALLIVKVVYYGCTL